DQNGRHQPRKLSFPWTYAAERYREQGQDRDQQYQGETPLQLRHSFRAAIAPEREIAGCLLFRGNIEGQVARRNTHPQLTKPGQGVALAAAQSLGNHALAKQNEAVAL